MNANTDTLDHLTEYLRFGWAKAVASPHATTEEKVTGSLKGTLLTHLEDHGPNSLLDFTEDYKASLINLHDHPATPWAIKTTLSRQIVVTEVVIARLRYLN